MGSRFLAGRREPEAEPEAEASAAELLDEGLLGEAVGPVARVEPERRDDLVLVAAAVVPGLREELLRRLVRLGEAVRPLRLPVDAVQPVPALGELLRSHGLRGHAC